MCNRYVGRVALALALASPIIASAAEPPEPENIGTAGPSDEATERARKYFESGALAYKHGQFLPASMAFRRAYAASPRPGLLFSISQAYRGLYQETEEPRFAKLAIKYYNLYLRTDSPRRAVDARSAIEKLRGPASRAPERVQEPRIKSGRGLVMIATDAPGATIQVAERAAAQSPYSETVLADDYEIEVSAPGYKDETLRIRVNDGEIETHSISLRRLDAELNVVGPEGGRVYLDGRLAGTAPLSQRLPHGTYQVEIRQSGRAPFSRSYTIGEGEALSLDADLNLSDQRAAAYLLGAVGVIGTVVGGTLSFLALEADDSTTTTRGLTIGGAALSGFGLGSLAAASALMAFDGGDDEATVKERKLPPVAAQNPSFHVAVGGTF